jgi:prepilin-type N-terminal cleavage/methylation domain-containing protein
MKTEFKAKFLQNISKKRGEEGFTLIELLVVIIIIGILSAIALPSFLNQANKAKQTEAKQYISSYNKGQQAYYAEQGSFITDIANVGLLGLGVKTSTQNYTYAMGGGTVGGNSAATTFNSSTGAGLKGYAGVVYLTLADNALTSQTVLCQSTGTGGTATLTAASSCGTLSPVMQDAK